MLGFSLKNKGSFAACGRPCKDIHGFFEYGKYIKQAENRNLKGIDGSQKAENVEKKLVLSDFKILTFVDKTQKKQITLCRQ
ncbi:MAG: hypothetical protein ACPG80_01605 [Rickettsiales bacterium]